MRAGAVLPALALAGCGAPTSYMGVDLRREPVNVADVILRDLARRAAAGDKAAQLALARRSEAGDGVPVDLDRACRLYASAAATTGGTIYVYQPPVSKGGAGRVMPITTPVSPGLSAARERLETLRYRASPGDRAASACLGAGR